MHRDYGPYVCVHFWSTASFKILCVGGIYTYVFKYLEKPEEGIGARIELEVQGVYMSNLGNGLNNCSLQDSNNLSY